MGVLRLRLLTGFIIITLSVNIYACGVSSNGISPSEDAKIGPIHPAQVFVALHNSSTILRWRGTGQDITHYQIYQNDGLTGNWQIVGTVLSQGDNRGWYTWNSPTPSENGAGVYGIVAFEISGSQSAMRTTDNCTIDLFDRPNEYKLCDGD
jgi:hypothetical protein